MCTLECMCLHTRSCVFPLILACGCLTLEPGLTVLKPGQTLPPRSDAFLPKVAVRPLSVCHLLGPCLDPSQGPVAGTAPQALGVWRGGGTGLWAPALFSPMAPYSHGAVTRGSGYRELPANCHVHRFPI